MAPSSACSSSKASKEASPRLIRSEVLIPGRLSDLFTPPGPVAELFPMLRLMDNSDMSDPRVMEALPLEDLSDTLSSLDPVPMPIPAWTAARPNPSETVCFTLLGGWSCPSTNIRRLAQRVVC